MEGSEAMAPSNNETAISLFSPYQISNERIEELQDSIVLPVLLATEVAQAIRRTTVKLGHCFSVKSSLALTVDVFETELLQVMASLHGGDDKLFDLALGGICLYFDSQISDIKASKYSVDSRCTALRQCHQKFIYKVKRSKKNYDAKNPRKNYLIEDDTITDTILKSGELGRC